MARIPRVELVGFPHHVTQRGNRRLQTFYSSADYRAYLRLITDAKKSAAVRIWAYCLMPNHVHHVIVPGKEDSLAALFSDAHRRYTRHINFREGWRGHLRQERFHSFVMNERYLLATVRYVELNPVRAGLCRKPQDWPWSSARAHLAGNNDALVSVQPMLARVDDWSAYLDRATDRKTADAIRQHARTGRPTGSDRFLKHLESMAGRTIRKRKPGPRRADNSD